MKKNLLTPEQVADTHRTLDEIESAVFGVQVQTDVRAGAGCPPWSCPRPLYGVPDTYE
ncbi:MAG: hypothetical protein AAGC60_01855 [Acidobacteriota bacterium]